MKINISTLKSQIEKRISNYQETINKIVYEASKEGSVGSKIELTDWHKKQVKSLEERISELKWSLSLLPEEAPFCLSASIGDDMEEKFLEGTGIFQKDNQGLFTYISENENHMTNLASLLHDYKTHLLAVSEVNKSKSMEKK